MRSTVVPDYPAYSVREDGVVVGPKGPLKPNLNGRGYCNVSLVRRVEGRRVVKSHSIHRLVAQAFVPNPNGHPEVNHKDGNKANNLPGNLEWVSSRANKLHATALGLYPTGSRHHNWVGGGPDHHRREARRQQIATSYQQENTL